MTYNKIEDGDPVQVCTLWLLFLVIIIIILPLD